MTGWVLAFAITCAVELAVVALLVRRATPWRLVLLAQLATHPLVYLAYPDVPLAAVEAFAVSVEAALYARAVPRPLAVSALANAASLAVALLTP